MEKKDIYIVGKKLGLNLDDINNVLNYELVNNEQANLSCGPNWYWPGTLYGTVSIHNFQIKKDSVNKKNSEKLKINYYSNNFVTGFP